MSRNNRHTDVALTVGQAAKVTGYSPDFLRKLDNIVNPVRLGQNMIRIYLSEHLDQIRAYKERRGRKKR